MPDDGELRRILETTRTIAVVGLSDKPERDSNEVARYLRSVGYRIVPVNPRLAEVLGAPSYPSVAAIPADVKVDLVDVFRRAEEVPPLIDEAIGRQVPVLWMQLGVRHPEAADHGRRHGLTVIEDLCIMATHKRLKVPARG